MMSDLPSIQSHLVDHAVKEAVALLADREPCEPSPRMALRRDDVRIAVCCDGTDRGAVMLRCSRPLATVLAARMLELPPEALAEADLLDAAGELVNVIAGNLRSMLARPGAMTTPFTLKQDACAHFTTTVANTYRIAGEGLQILRA